MKIDQIEAVILTFEVPELHFFFPLVMWVMK